MGPPCTPNFPLSARGGGRAWGKPGTRSELNSSERGVRGRHRGRQSSLLVGGCPCRHPARHPSCTYPPPPTLPPAGPGGHPVRRPPLLRRLGRQRLGLRHRPAPAHGARGLPRPQGAPFFAFSPLFCIVLSISKGLALVEVVAEAGGGGWGGLGRRRAGGAGLAAPAPWWLPLRGWLGSNKCGADGAGQQLLGKGGRRPGAAVASCQPAGSSPPEREAPGPGAAALAQRRPHA